MKQRVTRWLIGALLLLLLPSVSQAQNTGTVMPMPFPVFLNSTGGVCASCLLYTYSAGTTTPVDTYTEHTLNPATPQPNPITINAAGRVPTQVYLAAGSYKFVLMTALGTPIWTADYIPAIPASASNLDTLGLAGENITAGQTVYLSDGSGGKNPAQWYKADSGNPYSSLFPRVGIAPSSITSGAMGSIRLGGQATGLSGLTSGSAYYISTAGSVTVTAPANARLLGTADSTTTLIMETPRVSGTDPTETQGTAGEALTAGNVVYLSDGSGSKTPGSWYKADNTNTYSSTTPVIGVVPASIANGAVGTIRKDGLVSGMTSLTAGTIYYIGTTGALTATAPASNTRIVGQADTTTSLIVGAVTPVPVSPLGLVEGRLTLTSGTPVTITDVTGAVSIYFAPYKGNRIALYDGTARWNVRTFAEITLALGTLSSGKPYDIFAYDNSGVVALEMLAWTNDTARATALTLQDGVLVKTGATTRRYLGSFYTTSTTTTQDSVLKRYLWNYYNRVPRLIRVQDATDSYAYSLGLRQARGQAANQVDVMVGWAEDLLTARITSYGYGDASNGIMVVGIGEDSVTVIAPNSLAPEARTQVVNVGIILWAELVTVPAVGHHYYAWLEYTNAAANFTWYGDGGTPTLTRSGLLGVFLS